MTLNHIGEGMAVSLLIHWSRCDTALGEQNQFPRASSGSSKHLPGRARRTHSDIGPHRPTTTLAHCHQRWDDGDLGKWERSEDQD